MLKNHGPGGCCCESEEELLCTDYDGLWTPPSQVRLYVANLGESPNPSYDCEAWEGNGLAAAIDLDGVKFDRWECEDTESGRVCGWVCGWSQPFLHIMVGDSTLGRTMEFGWRISHGYDPETPRTISWVMYTPESIVPAIDLRWEYEAPYDGPVKSFWEAMEGTIGTAVAASEPSVCDGYLQSSAWFELV